MVSTHYDTQVDETISSISATHGSPKKAQERRGMSSYVMLCWKSVKLATFCNRRNGRKDLGVWSGMLTVPVHERMCLRLDEYGRKSRVCREWLWEKEE